MNCLNPRCGHARIVHIPLVKPAGILRQDGCLTRGCSCIHFINGSTAMKIT